MNPAIPCTIALATLLSGCALTGGTGTSRAGGPRAPREVVSPTRDAEPVRLYARDGSVVTGPPTVTATSEEPAHEVAGVGGSRYRMLELYQEVVDERDALALGVDRLNAALDQSRARASGLESELDVARADTASAETELERLRTENRDLAGRLTTAQIRRLEAEKLLLEVRIEWARLRGIGATDAPPPRLPESDPTPSSAAGEIPSATITTTRTPATGGSQ